MNLFTKPEPTFEQRLIAAKLVSDDATAAFLTAANDLDETGDELEILAEDTQHEIDRLIDIRSAATEDAERARKAALNLRRLIEPVELTLF